MATLSIAYANNEEIEQFLESLNGEISKNNRNKKLHSNEQKHITTNTRRPNGIRHKIQGKVTNKNTYITNILNHNASNKIINLNKNEFGKIFQIIPNTIDGHEIANIKQQKTHTCENCGGNPPDIMGLIQRNNNNIDCGVIYSINKNIGI